MLEQHLPHLGEKFRVWIEDAPTRTRLPEHDPHTSKDKVCCYIKSSVDQGFRVCVEWEGDKWCAQGSECWACYIYLDGQCIRAGLLGRWDGYTRREICVNEIDGGPGEAMSLHFGKTQTSGITLFLDERLRGGDSGIEDREMCDELGSIRVELRRARPLRPVTDGYHPHINKNLTHNVNSINVLKIHSAKYVSEPSQKTWKYWDCEFPLTQYNPSFVFKYRSQVSLELAGILPRTFPHNVDVETVDLSTLTPEIRGRVEEMQWIVDNVNKQKTYRAACKQNASDAELDAMLERRRQAYQERFSQSTSKDPFGSYPRWRY